MITISRTTAQFRANSLVFNCAITQGIFASVAWSISFFLCSRGELTPLLLDQPQLEFLEFLFQGNGFLICCQRRFSNWPVDLMRYRRAPRRKAGTGPAWGLISPEARMPVIR